MNTAGRRRRQAIGGYKHIPAKHRPRFKAARKSSAALLNGK